MITEKHKPSAFTDIGILAGTTGGGAGCGYAGRKYYLYSKLVKSFKAERARIRDEFNIKLQKYKDIPDAARAILSTEELGIKLALSSHKAKVGFG